MEVHLTPETESRLNELASQSGRPTDDLVEDAMAGYLAEVAEMRHERPFTMAFRVAQSWVPGNGDGAGTKSR